MFETIKTGQISDPQKNPLAFVVEFVFNLSFTIRWERKDKNLLTLYNKLSYARILIGF